MDRIKAVYNISGMAWKFYKHWSEAYAPQDRTEYFWAQVTKDLKNKLKELPEDMSIYRNVYHDLMLTYISQLQDEYCKEMAKRQEKLPI